MDRSSEHKPAVLMLRNQPDLEDLRPQLARHEQPLPLGIVGDSIQHCAGFQLIDRTQQTWEVDPADYFAVLRRYSGDSVRLPDVSEEFSLDKLQFI